MVVRMPHSREVVLISLLLVTFVALKVPTINLPAYHDETYVDLAGWETLHSAFTPFPRRTETFGHPPLVFELAALAWLALPPRPWALHVVSVALAAVALLFTHLVGKAMWDKTTGVVAATTFAVGPLFFAQAGLLQLDLAVTAFSLVAIYGLLRGRWIPYFLSASLMLLSKETSVCFIPSMVCYAWLRNRDLPTPARMRAIALASLPALVFLLWLLAHRVMTGFWWGDPLTVSANKEILASNLQMGLLKRFGIRWIQVLNPDRSGILPLVFILAAAIGWRQIRASRNLSLKLTLLLRHPALVFMCLASATYLVFHSIFGVLHPRDLLPIVPLVALVVAGCLKYSLGSRATYALALIVPFSIVGWFRPPDKFSAPEATLDYVDIVRAHQAASAFLEQHHGNEIVLASLFQSGANLTTPILGYVEHPLRVLTIGSDFAPSHAAQLRFDLVYLSSTDQFGDLVRALIEEKHMRQVARFVSGRHFVGLYR